MPILKPDVNFEPSRDTKYWWLYTRKTSSLHAGVTLPGLFQTSQFNLDAAAFTVIVIGEIYGLYNLFIVAQISILYVIGLFLADLIFAICRHIPQGSICKKENLRVLTDDPDKQARLHRQIVNLHRFSLIFTLLILSIALFKIVSFYALQGGVFDGITFAISLSYGIVGILHITSTGYFLSELLVSFLVWRDRNTFLSNIENSRFTVKTTRKFYLKSHILLENDDVAQHRIYLDTDGQTSENGYPQVMETWGVLTDNQLNDLIMQQKQAEQKRIVAIEGLRHQLDEILPSDPAR